MLGKKSTLYFYKYAAKKYKKSMRLISKLGTTVKEFYPDYDEEVAKYQFDTVLQEILLIEALSDSKIDEIECQFIELITDRGDLLQFLLKQSKSDVKVTWVDVAALPKDAQFTLISVLDGYVDVLSKDLALFLAIADAVTPKNYTKALEENLSSIAWALACLDGSVAQSEETFAFEAIDKYFTKPMTLGKAAAKAIVDLVSEIV